MGMVSCYKFQQLWVKKVTQPSSCTYLNVGKSLSCAATVHVASRLPTIRKDSVLLQPQLASNALPTIRKDSPTTASNAQQCFESPTIQKQPFDYQLIGYTQNKEKGCGYGMIHQKRCGIRTSILFETTVGNHWPSNRSTTRYTLNQLATAANGSMGANAAILRHYGLRLSSLQIPYYVVLMANVQLDQF